MAIGANWAEIWASVWGPVWSQTAPVLVEVPGVVGESQASATATLEGAGFVVAVDNAYSSTVAVGDVISQSPAAGAEVASGATVTIVVSLGEAPAPPPASSDATGGWAFYLRYERERERRRKRRREEEEAEEALEQLPPVEREIGQLLQRQEREDERRRDLERLRALVKEHTFDGMPKRVQNAAQRVVERQSLSSLLKLDKELRRLADEEEMAVLMVLLDG